MRFDKETSINYTIFYEYKKAYNTILLNTFHTKTKYICNNSEMQMNKTINSHNIA